MGDQLDGGYYAVIPGNVRYDPDLKPNAKLLYGELTSLCNKRGYCWATNEHFAKLYNLSVGTISRLIAQLEQKGYIRCEMAATEKGSERRIYAGVFLVDSWGIDEKRKTPLDKKRKGGLDDFDKQNNKNLNNKEPPKAPQGAAPAVRGRKRKPKAVPTWQPERFEGFWKAYPRDEDRAKAVEQWDKLPQDKELMARYEGSEEQLLRDMSIGLRRHLESKMWQDDVGIPYAFRWIRDRKWTEKAKCKPPPASAVSSALPVSSAPRPYRMEIINGEEMRVYDEIS